MQLVLITETPDLVLERNLSSGLPEQVPCDVQQVIGCPSGTLCPVSQGLC